MTKLALAGGPPVRTRPIPAHQTIGAEERRAALEVIDSGVLSGFLGTWSEEFYGGPRVRNCEQMFAERFHTRHAIAVNSATTGLQVALAAAGIEPGDEVILPPYTMSATTSAPRTATRSLFPWPTSSRTRRRRLGRRGTGGRPARWASPAC